MVAVQDIEVTHHRIRVIPEFRLVITSFRDGTEARAIPHDTDDYRGHASESGVGSDVDLYCLHHDIAHVIFGEMLGTESPVLRSVATGNYYPPDQLDREEEIAKLLQAYFNRYGWPKDWQERLAPK
jgi:hypothetical protein